MKKFSFAPLSKKFFLLRIIKKLQKNVFYLNINLSILSSNFSSIFNINSPIPLTEPKVRGSTPLRRAKRSKPNGFDRFSLFFIVFFEKIKFFKSFWLKSLALIRSINLLSSYKFANKLSKKYQFLTFF